jgi:hypothetical protein
MQKGDMSITFPMKVTTTCQELRSERAVVFASLQCKCGKLDTHAWTRKGLLRSGTGISSEALRGPALGYSVSRLCDI